MLMAATIVCRETYMSPLERHCCVAGLNRLKSIYHPKLVHCHVCAHDSLFLVACLRAAFIIIYFFGIFSSSRFRVPSVSSWSYFVPVLVGITLSQNNILRVIQR